MAEEKKKKGSANWIYGIIAVVMVGELVYGGVLLYGNMVQNFKMQRLRLEQEKKYLPKIF